MSHLHLQWVGHLADYQPLSVHKPLNCATEIYTLTPTKWNPHTDAYALKEESIVDWEGNIRERNHCDVKIVLDEIGDEYQNQYKISSMEAQHVDEVLKAHSQHNNNNNLFKTSELSIISSGLCPHLLTSMIEARTNLASDAINIGTMNCYDANYIRKVKIDNGMEAWEPVPPNMFKPHIEMLKNTLRSLITSGGKSPTRLKLLCDRHIDLNWMSQKSYHRSMHRTTSR